MSREVLVVFTHSLGREEARRRVASAVERAQASVGQGFVTSEIHWPQPDHASVNVRAMGQSVTGEIDVTDTEVRVRVLLPWLLAPFAEKITERIEQAGATLQIGHDPKSNAPRKV